MIRICEVHRTCAGWSSSNAHRVLFRPGISHSMAPKKLCHRLRHQIAVASVRLLELSAASRRHADRERKRAKSVLQRLRIKGNVFLAAATVSTLHPTEEHAARVYVYWYLKRMLRRAIGPLHGIDDAALDTAIADAKSGSLAEQYMAAMDNVNSNVHFAAARWIAEYDVFCWLIDCNLQGASPPSSDLFVRFRHAFPVGSRGERFERMVQGVSQAARECSDWAATFRRRWSVEFRQLPSANALTDSDLSGRACALVVSMHMRRSLFKA